MSRLADPLLCPDCRGQVLPGGQCSACGLMLNGPRGQELFRALLHADQIIERMRADQAAASASRASVGSSASVGAISAPPPAFPPTGPGPLPHPAHTAPRFKLPAATGRSVVLIVAAVLIFVAASLFLAVAWTILPLIMKALIMLGVTALFATFGWWLNHKGLRGSGEAVWGLTAALVTLDVSAAHRSGLFSFDALDARHVAGVVGLALVGLGIPAALWALTSAARRSIAAEVSVVVGVFAMLVGWVFQGPWNDGPQQAVAVPLVAAAGVALHRRLSWAAWGVLGMAGLTWLVLIASTLPHLDESRGYYWSHLHAWPMLVAAIYAAALTFVARLPHLARVAAAGAALVVSALALWLPVRLDTGLVLLVALVVTGLAGLSLVPSPVWRTASQYVGLGAGGIGALLLAALPWSSLSSLPPKRMFNSAATTPVAWDIAPSGWAVPVLGLAVAVASALLTGSGVSQRLTTWGVAPLAYGFAGASTSAGWPLPVPVTALAIAAAAAVVPMLIHRPGGAVDSHGVLSASGVGASLWGAGWAATALSLAFLLASANDVVTAALAAVAAAGLWVGFALRRNGATGAVLGGLAVVLTGYAALALVHLSGGRHHTQAVVLALLAAAAIVASRWLATGTARTGVEAGAGVVGLAACGFGAGDGLTTLAMAVTLIGSALALSAATDPARTFYAWPSAGVLSVATLMRFAADARFPEVYCLPAAAVLIGAGVWQMRRNPAESSWRVLAAGLSLVLLPSLLLAMQHPASVRSVLVALTAALALTLGIALRWQAPLVIGSGTLVLLAMRFLLPIARNLLANPFGPWLLFGALGVTCLVIGILWEQTQRGLRQATRYVGALR